MASLSAHPEGSDHPLLEIHCSGSAALSALEAEVHCLTQGATGISSITHKAVVMCEAGSSEARGLVSDRAKEADLECGLWNHWALILPPESEHTSRNHRNGCGVDAWHPGTHHWLSEDGDCTGE